MNDPVQEYILNIAEDKKVPFLKLRETVLGALPGGFREEFSYGMLGYVVPLALFPEGYRGDPTVPLPIMNLGCQKHYISLYHYPMYADPELREWFESSYARLPFRHKPDIGKSCIRFRYDDEIPFELVGELAGSISVDRWIAMYRENSRRRSNT